MKFLVFTTDLPPLPGVATSGTALRTYGLAQGLRAHGHDVLISVPRGAVEGLRARADALSLGPDARARLGDLERNAFDHRNQAALVHAARPDAVVCGHWPAAMFERPLAQPLVVDLAGPHLLERHYQGERNRAGAVLSKLRAVANADHFIVSGPKQRLYFFSYLLRAGVSEPEKRTVTITMPLDPRVPERGDGATGADPRFVFAGVFLPWQDPSRALDGLAAELQRRGRGRLDLIGGEHPHYAIPGGVYAGLFERLSRLPFVRTRPLLPYEALLEELRQADVAIDLMRWNLERELAMTIRSTTYLWSGLPVVYNDYADLGTLVRQYDAGWTVPPSEPSALRRVIDEVFDDPEAVKRKGRNASRLAREVFAWDRAVEPLLQALGASRAEPPRETDIALTHVHSSDLPVQKDRPLEQFFVSRIDGLCRVECFVTTRARTSVRDVTLGLYRLAGQAAQPDAPRQLVGERTVPAARIREGEWLSLDVPPVGDSAGGTFVFTIESEAATPDEAVGAWVSKAQSFPLLGLRHGGRAAERATLCIRTVSACQPR